MNATSAPDLILENAKLTPLDRAKPEATSLVVKNGRIVGVDNAEEYQRGPDTKVIDLHGRRVIPGLNDSHMHIIRGGLSYNLELRWDGVPSLADGLRMLKEQAQRTPPGQWVRVIGGWSEFQFAERRMPTLDEINAVSPETPVFVLHLYCRGMLNQAALRACGYTKDTPNPPGGEIQRDSKGNPTGLLIARPNATILYATLAKGPKLQPEHQLNSTRHFMRELNRLGLTSVIDAGGGFQNYPEDYAVIEELHKRGEMTVRIAYNLFTQKPKQEKEDFARWIKMTGPGKGDDFFRCNGAGEMLVFSAADFEDFLEPRPDLPASLEGELKEVVSLLAANKWPFRLHATFDESITRFLNVFEEVNRNVPFKGLNWFFDHCETVSDTNLERIKALGGGIAVQHRMAFQGEYFSVPDEEIKALESVLTVVGGKIVHATDEFAPHAPPPIPVLAEWSPVKVFGGYGAPLDVRKAARAGVPVPQHQHSAECHHGGCDHAAHQLLAGIEAARNRYAGF